MPEPLDLTDEYIATAIEAAEDRTRPMTLAYIDPAGHPQTSVRGTVYVRNATQLALWSRKSQGDFIDGIRQRPQIALFYMGWHGMPPPYMLNINGIATADSSANDEVYDAIPDSEKAFDPDRNGIAIIVDVTSLKGLGDDGPFQQRA